MAAVTRRPGVKRRRWVLVAVVVVWGVVVAGLAAWAIGHEPATVPEQRTIGQALPAFRAAVGSVFAAAGGPGRAVVLDELQVKTGCRVTPVRHGVAVTRDVTVYVRAGEQRGDIEAIAAALPAGYRAQVTSSQGGTSFALHADAGSFIAVDLQADVGDAALTVEVTSGCRPVGDAGVDKNDPVAGPAPAALGAVLTLLGAPDATGVTTQAVSCPKGATAATYTVGGVKAPGDWRKRLGSVASGTAVVRSDPTRWAYRAGDVSVVVVSDGTGLRVNASTAC
jgi:hypothetical protein